MRCGRDVWPLIGATATSTNEVFFCNGRDCHSSRVVHKKTADFRSPTIFSVWSRLKSYDPISLKRRAGFPQRTSTLRASRVVIPWGFAGVCVLYFAVFLVLSSAEPFSVIVYPEQLVFNRKHLTAGLFRGSGVVIPWANERINNVPPTYAFNVRESEDMELWVSTIEPQ